MSDLLPITFNQKPRPLRTPEWASRSWTAYRKQYYLGSIEWNDRNKRYRFIPRPLGCGGFTSLELWRISEFLREETNKHRYELFERKQNRRPRTRGTISINPKFCRHTASWRDGDSCGLCGAVVGKKGRHA